MPTYSSTESWPEQNLRFITLLATLPNLADDCLQNAVLPNGRVLVGYWNLVCVSVSSIFLATLPPKPATFTSEGYINRNPFIFSYSRY